MACMHPSTRASKTTTTATNLAQITVSSYNRQTVTQTVIRKDFFGFEIYFTHSFNTMATAVSAALNLIRARLSWSPDLPVIDKVCFAVLPNMLSSPRFQVSGLPLTAGTPMRCCEPSPTQEEEAVNDPTPPRDCCPDVDQLGPTPPRDCCPEPEDTLEETISPGTPELCCNPSKPSRWMSVAGTQR